MTNGASVAERRRGIPTVLQVVVAPVAAPDGVLGVNGPERHAVTAVPYFLDDGVEIVVAYPKRGRLWNDFGGLGIPVVDFEIGSKWNLRSILRLRKVVRSYRIGIVHTQGPPSVDLMATIAAKSVGAKVVVVRHSMIKDLAISGVRRRVYGALDRMTLALCDRIIAISDHGRAALTAQGNRHVQLIYNGFDVTRFANCRRARLEHARSDAAVVIGMCARLVPEKGVDSFLSVVASLRNRGLAIRCILAGEGPMRKQLEARIALDGLSDIVEMRGHVENVEHVLSEVDIYFMPSKREGLSIAIAEAMAAALPIVATDVGGTREQVRHGFNGFLFEPSDLQGMVEACDRLVRSEALRRTLGERSRQMAHALFSMTSMINAYIAVYQEVAASYP